MVLKNNTKKLLLCFGACFLCGYVAKNKMSSFQKNNSTKQLNSLYNLISEFVLEDLEKAKKSYINLVEAGTDPTTAFDIVIGRGF